MKPCSLLGNVNCVETMGLLDGPGIRIVVFMQGCHLRCVYCHNPETWCFKEENMMSVDEVVDKVLRYKSYISNGGGVTFSGGEPLVQSEFILECCKKLKKENIHICIDTAGVATGYEELVDYVDLFIVDIKSLDEKEYKDITGHNMDLFYKFMKHVSEKEKKMWLRQVIVPSINDDEEHVAKLVDYSKTLKNVEKVELLAYHAMAKEKYDKLNMKYILDGIDNLSRDKLDYLNDILNKKLAEK